MSLQFNEDLLVRVLIIAPSNGNFHFNGPEPMIFGECDWFRNEGDSNLTEEKKAELTAFIKTKNYYDERLAYLVLSSAFCFTIGYTEEKSYWKTYPK